MKTCSICSGTGKFNNFTCWLCNGTKYEKPLQEIFNSGKMRKAIKKEHKCEGCKRIISIGETYFDTGERIDIWKTYKYCINCVEERNK